MLSPLLRAPSFVSTLRLGSILALALAGIVHAQTGSFAQNGVNLGSVAVNTGTPATATLTFKFTAGGTIAAPAVVTQGAKNLDFTDAGTGTCTTNGTSHTYNANDSCTVVVKFTPKYAGTRNGAVVLYDSANAPIATAYIYGTGTGPEVVFSPSTQTSLGGAFVSSTGVTVDAAGNVYIADYDAYLGGDVKEIPLGCTTSDCVTVLGGGFSFLGTHTGVAVDGIGNVFVADGGNNSIKEIPPGCTSSACVITLGGSFTRATGVAVDSSGNVYVAGGGVFEMPAGCTSSSCVTALGGGFTDTYNNPIAVAVDEGGNVIVAVQYGTPPLVKMPPGCTSSSCVTGLGGGGVEGPLDVAVDGSGNVYVDDYSSGGLKEMPAGCVSSTCVNSLSGSGLDLIYGLTVDGSGNLYVVSYHHSSAEMLNRTIPAALTLPSTTDGHTSAPQTVLVQNIGNVPLTLPIPASGNNPAISGSFSQNTSGTNVCPMVASESETAGTLAASGSCNLAVNFIPPIGTFGNLTGSLTLTDDTLNAAAPAYASQTIPLSGTSTALPPFGVIAQPVDATTRSSTVAQSDSVLLAGWAADPQMGAPVSQVTVLIDGKAVGNATLGLARPGAATSQNNSSWYNSGWIFTYPAASLSIGRHTASAVAYDSMGLSTQLSLPHFMVSASPAPGPPFGSLDGAIDATTRSTTVAQSDNLLISGWAADIHDGAPVSSVSILIDGTAVGTATLGIARPDVAATEKNSAYLDSGWTFTYAASGLRLGTHTVSAVATDSLGLSAKFQTRTITVATTPVDGPPFGSLDHAEDATTGLSTVSQADNLFVSGWAADVHDKAPVSQVSILVDGTAVGNATLGFARPDVAKKEGSAYLNSGWRFTMSASSLSAGEHIVTAVATDSLGLSRQFELRAITVTP